MKTPFHRRCMEIARSRWAPDAVQWEMPKAKSQYLKEKLDEVKGSISGKKALRAEDLATQRGASVSLLFCQLEI